MLVFKTRLVRAKPSGNLMVILVSHRVRSDRAFQVCAFLGVNLTIVCMVLEPPQIEET